MDVAECKKALGSLSVPFDGSKVQSGKVCYKDDTGKGQASGENSRGAKLVCKCQHTAGYLYLARVCCMLVGL